MPTRLSDSSKLMSKITISTLIIIPTKLFMAPCLPMHLPILNSYMLTDISVMSTRLAILPMVSASSGTSLSINKDFLGLHPEFIPNKKSNSPDKDSYFYFVKRLLLRSPGFEKPARKNLFPADKSKIPSSKPRKGKKLPNRHSSITQKVTKYALFLAFTLRLLCSFAFV